MISENKQKKIISNGNGRLIFLHQSKIIVFMNKNGLQIFKFDELINKRSPIEIQLNIFGKRVDVPLQSKIIYFRL